MTIADRLRLDGRVVVLTGAAGNIGTRCALAVAEAGAIPVLLDRDEEGLVTLSQQLEAANYDHVAFPTDTTDADAVGAVVGETVERVGSPSGLVCLVGGVHPGEFAPFLGGGIRTYDTIVDRNLRSAVVAHEVVGGAILASGRGGSMVSITAATAFVSSPFHAMYGAAKAGVVSLARTLAVEWGPLGVRVNTIAPGGVETTPPNDPEAMARAERAAIPLGRRVVPDEIAATALFLLSDLAGAISGQTLILDGAALSKPSFIDADNVPVFISDPAMREHLRGSATHLQLDQHESRSTS